jgi:ribosomal protein S27AE
MNTSDAAILRTYKERTRIATRKAIKDGKLTKPLLCGECGTSGKIHAHHDDYTKPLEVRWLCKKCHDAAHVGSHTYIPENYARTESGERLARVECARCGHTWLPRVQVPLKCPRCLTINWRATT